MHASSLVRRLLRRRELFRELLDAGLDIGQRRKRHSEASDDVHAGRVDDSDVIGPCGEGDVHDAVIHPQLGEVIDVSRLQQRVLDNLKLNFANTQQTGSFGHRVPPDELNQHFAGQLPFKSSGAK